MVLSILLLLLGLAGATAWRSAQLHGTVTVPLSQRLATPTP
ncbi:MAG: hypothetical protein NTZ50_10470 [Chloroflexi bacterium]|nr:hypothetical protein [Chloroflexota bacterium]